MASCSGDLATAGQITTYLPPRDIVPPENQFANLLSHFLKDYIAEYNPIRVSSTYGGVHFYRSHVIVVELGC